MPSILLSRKWYLFTLLFLLFVEISQLSAEEKKPTGETKPVPKKLESDSSVSKSQMSKTPQNLNGSQKANGIKSPMSEDTEIIQSEVRTRIATYKERIAQLNKDLDGLRQAKANVPPLVIPKKASYPPKPVKRDTASTLKMGEFEDEATFSLRIKAAKENDEREFHFDEIAWNLAVQEIDSQYETLKKDLEEKHQKKADTEIARIAKIKEDFSQIEKDTNAQIESINKRIQEEEALLKKLGAKDHHIEPVVFLCTYTELPWFDRSSMSFHGVYVSCTKTKIPIGDKEYSVSFEYILTNIKFSSLAEAKSFKELSERGELYCMAVSDELYWQKEAKKATPFWSGTWSEDYVPLAMDSLLPLWKKITAQGPAPAFIPLEKADEASGSESNLENIETAANPNIESQDSGEMAPDDSKNANTPVDRKNQSLSSLRIIFGTADKIIDNLEITVDGAFTMTQPVDPALEVSDSSSSKDTLQHPTEDPSLINKPGSMAGESRNIYIHNIPYTFRWCPSGTFNMGTGKRACVVTLSKGFWMLESEVTQEMYRSVTNTNPSNFRNDKFPVEYVNWVNCLDFCEKLSNDAGLKGVAFTLPTEAQWEYACRAGTESDFSFGSDPALLCQYGNYCDATNSDGWAWRDEVNSDGFDKTAPVKSYKPNAWGLYDMHGNVWEWCSSRYGAYPRIPVTDPLGQTNGTFRIFRGGSWSINATYCSSAIRFGFTPDFRRDDIGFRICLVPSTPRQ